MYNIHFEADYSGTIRLGPMYAFTVPSCFQNEADFNAGLRHGRAWALVDERWNEVEDF